MKSIYITQFGGWWKFTNKEFIALCDSILAGNEGEYRQFGKQLQRRPSCIAKEEDGEKIYYYSTSTHADVFRMPCDWDLSQWKEAKDQVSA